LADLSRAQEVTNGRPGPPSDLGRELTLPLQ
jgi:hypothetical protein